MLRVVVQGAEKCPFCGKKDVFTQTNNFFDELVTENGTACLSIECPDCNVEVRVYGHTDYYSARSELIAKWNRRA